MTWSPQQDQALVEVDRWLESKGRQVYRLFGYAGTGKTTLAKHFADNADGMVLFAAYTGKAAHVLRQKGCKGASTIHSLIYNSRDKSTATIRQLEAEIMETLVALRAEEPDDKAYAIAKEKSQSLQKLNKDLNAARESAAQPFFTLNPVSAVRDCSLVVIDECSMVDAKMGEDLLSFGKPVLVVGDPAQLPPVMGGGFFTDQDPDFMLTEIHRQARGNPIIDLATKVRNKEKLDVGTYGESRVIEMDDPWLRSGGVQEADQVLVGRNRTRRSYNKRLRKLNGIEETLPIVGDRLVCLRNNHECGLLNGAIWYVDDVGIEDEDELVMSVHAEDDNTELEDLSCHSHYFKGNEENLAWYDRKNAEEFDFGYALTVHKSQGSQWNNVVLFDESFCFRQDKHRWLYTGLTRAADQITVVKT